jgi:hypothetical protein
VKIEHGVPIPPPLPGQWKRLGEQMRVGDSVLLETQKDAYALRAAMHRMGRQVSYRKIAGEGWRIWRVEDKKPKFGLRAVG